jgi:Uma2 family endonuclease
MQTLVKISPEEYLIEESHALQKSEYHAGEVVAMAGAQTAHNRIVANVQGELYICLKNGACVLFPSDMLLSLPACEKYVYPDIMVVCETPVIEKKAQQGLDVLHNPSIIIEVMSKTTAVYDKTGKDCYLLLESLQQYVLIDSEAIEVITYTRTPENDWLMHKENDLTQHIQIGDCNIALQDIYHKIGF